MTKRQWIISLIVSLLILLIGAFTFRYLKSKKESTVSDKADVRAVRTVEVSNFPPQSVKNTIELDGRLNAYEKINLSAEVQGRLLPTGKSIKVGSTFAKGDILYQIESKDDEYSLKAQRSQLFNFITQIMADLKFDYPAEFPKWQAYLDAFNIESTVKPLP
jgi:membrane fusion protein, multidrug efflux system